MQTTAIANVKPVPLRLNRPFTLDKGTTFDCVPSMPISSAMVGPVHCYVDGNVWSMDGSNILLPDKTKVFGTIERGLANGERRLFIVWTDALTPLPDQLPIPLGVPASDPMGQMGVPGDVNEHLWQKLRTTLLLSAVEFVTGAGIAAVQEGGRNVINLGGVGSLGRAGNSLARDAFGRDADIPATLERGPARTLKVYINKYVDLSNFYRNVVVR